ncbi:MAG: methionyl-tRNA formyltransferase [Treponema sp.]|nr:methionyl-tRNA formyltransferase [Treponema sp.]
MRIFFAGSPPIAVPALEALLELADLPDGRAAAEAYRFELAGVLTNPDSPRGRSGKPEPTAVGAAAALAPEKYGKRGKQSLAVIKAPKLDAAVRSAIAALEPDLLVAFAYGRIFGPKFLALFPLGGINIHPSLLPKYRGAAPIPAAILHRERETGISIQRLAAEMDAGDILARKVLPLTGRETTETLSKTVAEKTVPLLMETLKDIGRGTARAEPQNHGEATYCTMLSREDGRIDWNQSAADIDARIRAFNPWPLCWTKQGDQLLYILEASTLEASPGISCPPAGGRFEPGDLLGIDKQGGILVQTGDGVLVVSRLQYHARKALDWRAFLNGARGFMESRLG